MRVPRLYCPSLTTGSIHLPPEEAHHLSSALRLGAGDAVILFDGAGTEGSGVIQNVKRREAVVDVASVQERPFDAPVRLTLSVAMGKAHRQGYLIEKCTELGVSAIRPLLTARSVTRPGPSSVARWSRRAVEASKQSGRAWVPEILPPQRLVEVLDDRARFDWVGFADTEHVEMSWGETLSEIDGNAAVLMFVGPEGGFEDAERQILRESGAVAVSLASTILRTETASVVVCAGIALRGAGRHTG